MISYILRSVIVCAGFLSLLGQVGRGFAEDVQPPTFGKIGSIDKPRTVTKSRLHGLTEAQILKTLRIRKLDPVGKDDRKKSYPGERSAIPILGGYVYTRHNVLTFERGKVIRHEIVDRVSACVITEPRGE
jgi:hypothetical protein